MAFESNLLDLADTGTTIRSKDETEDLREEVVELLALPRFFELRAVGTRGVLVFDAAGPDLAPARLFVFVTTRATISSPRRTGTAVDATVSDQFRIDSDFLHSYLQEGSGLVFSFIR